MTDATYPYLGFNPAEGNVATVRDLAGQFHDTGKYAGEAYEVLKAIQNKNDVWTGNAAESFADKLGPLPGYLDTAQDSMAKADKALSQWADELAAHQQRARELEDAARRAVTQAEQASEAAQEAYNAAEANGDPEAQARLNAAYKAAKEAANKAWGDVEDIRQKAHAVRDRWRLDADDCAKALREAGEVAPDEGFFEMVGEGIVNNLGTIANIAGIISTIAGILSFIPVVNFIAAPIALISGAVALGAHATSFTMHGKWDEWTSYVTLAGDVLGMIPGAGVFTKGMDEVVSLAKSGGKVLADDAAQAGARLTTSTDNIAATGLKSLGNKTLSEMSEIGASTAEKVAQASVDVVLQVPTVTDMVTDGGDGGPVNDTGVVGSLVRNLVGAVT